MTVRTDSFEERVRAAAESGCAAIGLRAGAYEAALAAGATEADLRAILAAHGVAVAEYEVLRHWASGGEEAEARSRQAEGRIFAMADALGGRHVIVVAEQLTDPPEVVAQRLAGLAERAAAHGLVVALEFLPWTDVPDAATAWELVRLADHPNAGILVDSWHLYRGAADYEQLRAMPPERIVALHIDDAEAAVVGTVYEDTLHRRRLPGDGSFPLVEYVRVLDELGVTAPFGIEIISDELAEVPARDAARLAVEATRRVLATARAGSGSA
jgi:sugar phosphate isomerase/epimerase